MLIDWFTVGAQIINFLVLIWLLKRFLYKPLQAALALRDKTIADNLNSAAAAKAEAETERLAFQQNNQELERNKSQLLIEAQESAERLRQQLLDQARKSVDAQQAEWEQLLRQERAVFFEQLGKQLQQEVQLIARRFLQELAGADLEEQMVRAFINRLNQPDALSQLALDELLQGSDKQIVVRSTFRFSEKLQQLVKETLVKKTSAADTIVFEQSPELLCGIELLAQGKKISWTLDQYFAGLRQNVEKILEQKKEAEGGGE